MTRRRDLFIPLSIYGLSLLLYFILNSLVLKIPFSANDMKVIYISIGIQTLLLFISSFYVWRANIVKTKAMPEYLIDFPDSTIYLLLTPILIVFVKTVPFIEQSSSLLNTVLLITPIVIFGVGLVFVFTILVEGIALFASSKYTQLKNSNHFNHREEEKNEK